MKQKTIQTLFFLIAFSFQLIANEETFRLDGLSDPSSYILGCVNAITGSLNTSFADVVVDGPEPLSFIRHYCSANRITGTFGEGFGYNHVLRLKRDPYYYLGGLSLEETGGDKIWFQTDSSKEVKEEWYYINPDQLEYGMTNAFTGELSGRNNIKNSKILMEKENKSSKNGKCTIFLGDGTKRYYDMNYWITHQVNPSGNRIRYVVDHLRRIKEIQATGPLGQMVIGWIKFTYSSNKKSVNIEASNGKTAAFSHTGHIHDNEYRNRFRLTQSFINGHKDCSYDYEKFEEKKGKLIYQDYLMKKIDRVGSGFLKFTYTDKKIDSISMPDKNNKPTFVYFINHHPSRKQTSVKDVLGGKSTYYYSSKQRLKKVTRHDKKEVYSSNVFTWGDKSLSEKPGKPLKGDKGNLLMTGLANAAQEVLSLTTYVYDDFGNVLKETVAGHLTGDVEPTPFIMNSKNLPILEGRESYSRFYTYTSDGFNLVSSLEEDDGTKTTWRYKPGTNRPVEIVTYDGNQIVKTENFEYNILGVLVKKTVEFGGYQRLITTIVPNDNLGTRGYGKPLQITESYWDYKTNNTVLLNRIDYTYGLFDLVLSEAHYNSNNEHQYTLHYKYDDLGNCIEKSDPVGRITEFKFENNHQCVFERLIGSGFATYFTYDTRGRLVKTEEKHDSGEVFTSKVVYDNLNRKICDIDQYGNKTNYSYDVLGRIIKITKPSFIGKNQQLVTPIVKKQYNIWDQMISETDADGHSIKTKYTSRGDPVQVNYPDGTAERFRYNLNGTLREKIYKNNSFTKFTYDGQRRLVSEETFGSNQELIRSKHYGYEGPNLVFEIDPMGNVTKYKYDGAGRRIEKIQQGELINCREEYGYDSMGRKSTIKKWYGQDEREFTCSIQVFDNLDRLIEERLEDSQGKICSLKQLDYDINGNCTKVIGYNSQENKSIQQTIYNSYKLPIKNIDPLGYESYAKYDFFYHNEMGQNVLKMTQIDSQGVQTVSIHDSLGRICKVEKFNSKGLLLASESKYYTANSLKTEELTAAVIDGEIKRQYLVQWTFDSMGRPIKVVEDPANKNKTTSFTYTNLGNLKSKTKPDGIILNYEYDELGREIGLSSSDGSINYCYSLDLNGNLLESRDLEQNSSLLREYDCFNNLISESFPNGTLMKYQYDGYRRITGVQFPDQTSAKYSHGPIDVEYVAKFNSEGVEMYRHRYDACDWMGRSLCTTLITGEEVRFDWDLIGHLISLKTPYLKQSVPSNGYDSVGNLLCVQFESDYYTKEESYRYDDIRQLTFEDNIQVHSYKCDSLNNRIKRDLQEININSLSQIENDEIVFYTYDLNGNLSKQDGLIEYKYDALDRLIELKKPNVWKIEYTYDSFGRCMSIKSFVWGGSWIENKIKFLIHQGIHEIGSVDKEGNIKEFRLMGKRENGTFRTAIAVELNGVCYAPIYDHRMNIRCLIDKQNQIVSESYAYSAFGESVIFDEVGNELKSSQLENPWLFSNKRYDPISGLYNYGKRFYSPTLGRWITPDPADFIDGPNLYAYTRNQPMICTDFFGFFTQCVTIFPVVLDTRGDNGKHHIEFFRPVGKTIEFVSRYTLFPNPAYQYIGEGIGRKIAGESYGHEHSGRIKPYSDWIDGKSFPNARVRLVFGIMTSPEEAHSYAEKFSQSLGGYEVYYTCHQTVGFKNDLIYAATEVFSLPTPGTDHLEKTIRKDFKEMSEQCKGECTLYLQGHSRGGLEIKEVGAKLPKVLTERINVTTLGTAGIIGNGIFKKAVNYANPQDIVFKMAKKLRPGEDAEIVYTDYLSDSIFSGIHSHYINSKGYLDVSRELCKKIIEKEGE